MDPSAPSSAFSHWKSARAALSDAIQEFSLASATLREFMIMPTKFHQPLQDILDSIDPELDVLDSDRQKFEESRAALSQARNSSQTTVTFNRISPEIIAKIFEFSCARYKRNDRTRWNPWNRKHASPVTLSAVCSAWRILALQTPSIWSEIDVVVGAWNGYRGPQLWAERARDLPLSLTVCEHSGVMTSDELTKDRESELEQFLASLMPRVYALESRLDEYTYDLSRVIISSWVQNNHSSTKKTLEITGSASGYEPYTVYPDTFKKESGVPFLEHVTRLTLRGCLFDWKIMMPAGLVDLHLENIPPTGAFGPERLGAVLSQCPNLCSFAVINCYINPMPKASSPVTMNNLRVLCLESTKSTHGLYHILPVLNIQSTDLDMSLSLSNDETCISAAHSFFERTNVKKLYARNIEGRASLQSLLCSIPSLEELVLDRVFIFDDPIYEFYSGSVQTQKYSWWPSLRVLYLNSVWTEFRSIETIHRHSILLDTIHLSDLKNMDDSEWTYKETKILGESLNAWHEVKVCYDTGSPVHWTSVILK
ncbi:F-box-like protein [Ceratobasidium sp. AG-Ba]|nr:F-box-like protein [Ceratobasidium sp. AG-Ba]